MEKSTARAIAAALGRGHGPMQDGRPLRGVATIRTQNAELAAFDNQAGTRFLSLNGKIVCSDHDAFLFAEYLVHPPLLAHEEAVKVLVLGSMDGAVMREVLRWKNVERVVAIHPDREGLLFCIEHFPKINARCVEDPRLEILVADPIDYLLGNAEPWDVIIAEAGIPGDQPAALQRALAPEGRLSIYLGSGAPGHWEELNASFRSLRPGFHSATLFIGSLPWRDAPSAFALCAQVPVENWIDPFHADFLLKNHCAGSLRAIDGESLLGAFRLPIYLRKILA